MTGLGTAAGGVPGAVIGRGVSEVLDSFFGSEAPNPSGVPIYAQVANQASMDRLRNDTPRS